MREILSNDLLGTPSANGHSIDRIGVMPDLKKIIKYIYLANSTLNTSVKTPMNNPKINIFSHELY
jgi:hypothetical protein